MKPEIKGGLYSPDLNLGPPQLPEDPEDCWIVMYADLGLEREEGADTFTFYVCTPRRLNVFVSEHGYELGRGLIIVKEFDWSTVRVAIDRICMACAGPSWEEIVDKLSRYGIWDYEDYQA